MRIQPCQPIKPISEVPPVLVIPPYPEKPKPGEPFSFCGHLHRLMMIQQRHIALQKLMNWWMAIGSCLRHGAQRGAESFNKIV